MHSTLLTLSLLGMSSLAVAGPCDSYSSGGTPCVAAHSTIRALYSAYTGCLYQVLRASDNTTKDIIPLSAGGIANSSIQDSFCVNTDCLISIIYDQSGNNNNLLQAPPGGAANGTEENGYDTLANATAAPISVGGKKVYGVFIEPGMGYRQDKTVGIATGDEPEGIYAVLDGTHYNNDCCFDYGNAETNNLDNGKAHMEAIYFGSGGAGVGSGDGPWVEADLENGLYAGGSGNPSITFRFVTAVVKGDSGNQWAIRGGDATSGEMSTFFSGERPAGGYSPMLKEGAIILGIGGDNSDRAEGTFYEGAMTAGYPSDETEADVQADIVAAKYAVE
jgi:hypothetical protein